MTDRHAGYIVVLKEPIREDDAESTISAISMIKNVISVKPIIQDVNIMLAELSANNKWTNKILDMLGDSK